MTRLCPMAEATAAGHGVRLQPVNLPAASAFVNPDSAHHGPRHEPLDAGDVPRPSTCRVGVPVARSAARPSTAGAAANGAKIKPASPASAPPRSASRSMPPTCRSP
jgi:hypothetical protein